jgi:uncharacterized protein (DUF488 family)
MKAIVARTPCHRSMLFDTHTPKALQSLHDLDPALYPSPVYTTKVLDIPWATPSISLSARVHQDNICNKLQSAKPRDN